ncbi:hypothetical protein [Clostridium massiliodielmoense]|uniref:hypothetical protein n=1 Tax=Clostridium massiliodielmoense TaxID=1776385 RepID=UPI0004D60DB4|nr:hypothetical protein [Clostridium massiliodielmoense]KEH92459.1 hypothetical protein Z962_11610 [Clostridium botulinum C/D str. BKT12695]
MGFICAIFFINWLLYFTSTSIIINYKSLLLIFRIIIFSGICTAATVSLNFMVAIICNNILVTLLCPIALMVISWLAEICGNNVSRFLPFRSIWLIIGENLNIKDIIVTIISSIIMFSLCIGISLMYVNKKDFK